MPRKLTDAEIEAQKEFMYERTVKLISKKGISSITLDEILDTVQMAKGTFYRYYNSKEIFLYEVIKKSERLLFEKLIKIAQKVQMGKENMFEEMYGMLEDKDSLFMSLAPGDVEKLLRKMPSDYRKQEEEKSINNFVSFCNAMKINPTEEFFGALTYLMYALQAIATSTGNFGESGKKRANLIIVQSICGLFSEEMEKNGR